MAELLPLPRPRDPRRNEPRRNEPRHDERRHDEPLWREMVGALLRRLRHARGERLADTAARAGVSPQYLSEVERGIKEPSSEMIAAIAGALGVTLLDLTTTIALELRAASVPAPAAPAAYVLAA
jgi:ribosome-binding protein aMBF1 (putative translation factor)